MIWYGMFYKLCDIMRSCINRMYQADVDETESEVILNDPSALGNFNLQEVIAPDSDAPAAASGAEHGMLLPEHACRAGADVWLHSVQLSVSALQHRHAAMQTFRADGSLGPNLSLVEQQLAETGEISLQFVHWGSAGGHDRYGRPVALDENSKVIFSVPSAVKKVSYADALIVHPDVGVRMLKVRKPERPPVCTEVLRLKQMWAVASTRRSLQEFNAADVADDVSFAFGSGQQGLVCCVCSQAATEQCPMCLLGYHGACSSSSLLCASQGMHGRPDMDRLRRQVGKVETPDIFVTEFESGSTS